MRQLAIIIAAASLLLACSEGVPLPERKQSNSATRFEIDLPQGACNSGDPVYSIQDQKVDWISYKTDENVPVSGLIRAAGWLKLGDAPDMQVRFNPESLDSEDILRDDRIKDFVLGRLENKALNFAVSNGPDLVSALEDGAAEIEFDIEGDLEIFGDWISTTIPVVIKKEGKVIQMENRGLTQIDLRASSFLTQKLVELLEIAEVESMKDEVDLSFKFLFQEEC